MKTALHIIMLTSMLLIVPNFVFAQRFTLGAGIGAVKPESLNSALGLTVFARFPVVKRFNLQANLSGWSTSEQQEIIYLADIDSDGNEIFEQQLLDYPVSDLSLSFTAILNQPIGNGFQILGGAGIGFHMLVSDLHRLEIEDDTESRTGAHLMAGIEKSLSRLWGVYLNTQYDFVSKLNHFRLMGGITITP